LAAVAAVIRVAAHGRVARARGALAGAVARQRRRWGTIAAVTVAAQEADAGSMLALFRTALALRSRLPGLGDGELTWRPAEPGVLAFDRDPGFTCVVNLSDGPVALPSGARVLVSSVPLVDGRLPADAGVWLER